MSYSSSPIVTSDSSSSSGPILSSDASSSSGPILSSGASSSSGSKAALDGHLWVLYESTYFGGDVRYLTFDSPSFNLDWNGFADQFSNIYLSTAWGPTAVEYDSKLYVFHGSNGTNTISYTTFDGTSYSADTQLSGIGLTGRPSLVVFNGQLYLFHQAADSNTQIYYSVFDSTNGWGPETLVDPQAAATTAPAAVVFGSSIYLFYRTSSTQINYRTFSGSGPWSIEGTVKDLLTNNSPAPVVFNDSLYVFCEGKKGGTIWYTNTSESGSWNSQIDTKMGITGTPSLVVMNSTLYIFHQGNGNNGELWCNTSTNPSKGWTGDTQIKGISLNDSPGAVLVDF